MRAKIVSMSAYTVYTFLLSSVVLYMCLLNAAYKDMNTFEYYRAAHKHFNDQIQQSRQLAGLERKQLKMILANVAHDMKTPLIALDAGIHSL
jgi:hypothetical protein